MQYQLNKLAKLQNQESFWGGGGRENGLLLITLFNYNAVKDI
jgi:hypothetical protein